MALTLAESAKLSTDQLVAGVIETIVQKSPMLTLLPFQEIQGNAYSWRLENALPGVAFRAVNSGYTESTGTFTSVSESLAILGGTADVDRFIQQTRSNLFDQRATQTSMKAKAVAIAFNDNFINGDTAVNANGFNGLDKKLTGTAQEFSTATNGLPVVGASASDQHAFFDKLDALLYSLEGPADALFMSSAILGKIRSSARRLGGWDSQRNEFGMSVDFYNGVPMFDMGSRADGTPIIPDTQTQGSASDASTIYAVRFADAEGDAGLMGLTNGGVQAIDQGLLPTPPAFRTLIEFYVGLALYNIRGAAKLKGVRNA